MSEEKKAPELEGVEDDDLQDVAGGINIMQDFRLKKPIVDEIPIPGIPSEESSDQTRTNVKR